MDDEAHWMWWLGCVSGERQCGKCGVVKPISEFVFKDKDRRRRHSWCRDCFAGYKRDWYIRNRATHLQNVTRNRAESTATNQARTWQYLAEHACVDCGESDPVVLEFDHVGEKLMDVSHMALMGFTWASVEAEIAKCEVRCANCHRRKTARERGFYDRKRAFMTVEEAWTPYRLFDN
jgi:hypothetical protein